MNQYSYIMITKSEHTSTCIFLLAALYGFGHSQHYSAYHDISVQSRM